MTKYLAYAGIGSRKTPDHILMQMKKCAAYLYSEGWTLRSGGADGADKAFEDAVNDMEHIRVSRPSPSKEIYLPWSSFNGSNSALNPSNYPFTKEEYRVAAMTHPAWGQCSQAARKMHTRNVRQVLGCRDAHNGELIHSKFVICWTPGGRLEGGTAQAIRIANDHNIPVINFGSVKDPDDIDELLVQIDKIQIGVRE